jgi:riboflavin kinase / FMN adenylyltransferase
MKIIEDYIENMLISDELSVALGNFDGIHLGHRQLIEKTVALSKELKTYSAVLTFDIHPLKVLNPGSDVKIITNNSAKAKIIEALGVDYLFFVKFNEKLANSNEKEFIEILKRNLKCEAIVCGYNYTYGKYGQGNINTLQQHQKEFKYDLFIFDKISFDGQDISSSYIRDIIESGNIKAANKLLGYNYFLFGKVIKCKQLGRELGFPTANIEIVDNLCIKNGVYISIATIDGKKYNSISSVGKNPTVNDTKRMLETHIFDFDEDIYGKEISVDLLDFIRGEKKFNSLEELKERVFADIDIAKKYFLQNHIYNNILF